MTGVGDRIRARVDEWGAVALPLERAVFGTEDPDAIARAVSAWCAQHLGAGIDHYEFFDSSSGSVHGVALSDGRRVVVKVHRASVRAEYLREVFTLQSAFARAGWPAPIPLVAPVSAPPGHITAEAAIGPIAKVDAHAPHVRAVLARGLARFVETGAGLAAEHDLALEHPLEVRRPGALYPAPHSERFDFDATSAGAEWIDALAHAAQLRLAGRNAPAVVAHGDWRIDNIRVVDNAIAAIYDWDSVGRLPEPNAVAAAAVTFTVDWERPDGNRFPTPPEIAAFVADYEAERGRAVDHDELGVAMVATLAYGARCEHADASAHASTGDSFTARLRELGAPLLDHGLAALDETS